MASIIDDTTDAQEGTKDGTKSTRKRKTTPAPNGPVAGNPSGPAMAGGPSGPAMSGGPSGPTMAGGEAPKRRRKTLKDNDTLRQLLG